MKILRTTDIVTLKHNEIEVDFSPLRYDKSLEVAGLARVEAGNTIVDMAKQTALMVKYSVREVRGVTDYNENQVTIKSTNGELTEDDISTVITILSKTPFIAPISFISTSCVPKKYDGIEIKINGKVLELGE